MDCCHCQKTKHRSDEEQKRLTNRLNRIEGQVRGFHRQKIFFKNLFTKPDLCV